ncbi:nucleoside phosphorylase domain-containing protein [Ilyonectria destructans]|nr:nucleoside phosphorylase domain-containing protein [Ilyonectria destructans]
MSNPEIYSVGWICALPKELVAARLFVDEVHPGPDYVKQHDNNCYTLGRIGKHNVVIASLPMGEYGTVSAASVARDMLHTFPNIRIGLMVGIGGGAPSEKNDIRLGDVVVSLSYAENNGGVYQYDYASTIEKHELQKVGHLDAPPYHFRTAMANLESAYATGNEIAASITNILDKKSKLKKKYGPPSLKTDRLYRSDFVHPQQSNHNCETSCNESNLVAREQREIDDYPTVHYGIIASANCLMMDANLRDKFAEEQNVLCFEMEAAGLMNHFPCIVIRGICDYSDSHKNYDWQEYAAMTAAAYTKELLLLIPQNDVERERIAANHESEQVESRQKVGE